MQNENINALSEQQRAQISDLADDQLSGAAFADALALLQSNSEARATWYSLHIAGDVLRGETVANEADSAKDMAFLDIFRANLAKEPVLMPLGQISTTPSAVIETVANDSFFNWKWLGGLSAAAAVVAFSWNLAGTTLNEPIGSGAQLASSTISSTLSSPSVETQTAAGVLMRNPQLDALIAAHNQVGGSSALQMPSGFLRSATFMPTTVNSDSIDK